MRYDWCIRLNGISSSGTLLKNTIGGDNNYIRWSPCASHVQSDSLLFFLQRPDGHFFLPTGTLRHAFSNQIPSLQCMCRKKMKTFRVAIIHYTSLIFLTLYIETAVSDVKTMPCHDAECFPSMSIVRVVPIAVGVSWSGEEEERAAKPVLPVFF